MDVLLLPGMDGTGTMFAPLVRAFPPSLTAHVGTYPADRVLPYASLLPQIALPRGKFLVVAESFSGPLGVMLAHQCDRVTGLVLASTFLTNPIPAYPRALAFLVRPMFFRRAPSAFAVRNVLLGRGAPDAEVRALRATLETVQARVLAARVHAIIGVDVTEAYARITVPILVLRATRDRLVSPRCAEAMVRLNPRARLVDVDAPHMVLQTRAAEMAELIAQLE